jgi:Fic family protein
MDKNRFNKRIKIIPSVLDKIAKIEEYKGQWRGGIQLNPKILNQLKSTVIITSSGASTRIEGAKMSDAQVARLLRGLKTRAPKNRDEQEVAGYADLLGRIFNNHKTLKLSENTILQFHGILLHYSIKDQSHSGKYKTANNDVRMKTKDGKWVMLFRPTPPYLVQPEMSAIINWTNQQLQEKSIHPILIIANFIFEFLAIHPFLDGNGRLSRALTSLLLLQQGYPYVPYVSLDEIIEDTKEKYYLALRATQKRHRTKREDIIPWLEYLLDILLVQASRSVELISAETPEKMLSERQSQVFALFRDSSELSVADIDAKLKHKIPQVTIKQALSRLVVLRLLERIGRGRGTRYRKK